MIAQLRRAGDDNGPVVTERAVVRAVQRLLVRRDPRSACELLDELLAGDELDATIELRRLRVTCAERVGPPFVATALHSLARRAADTGDDREAAACWFRAVHWQLDDDVARGALLARAADDPWRRRLEAYDLVWSGQFAPALDLDEATIDAAVESGDHELEAWARVGAAFALEQLHRSTEAIDHLEQAVGSASAHRLERLEVVARINLGNLLVADARLDEAMRTFGDAARITQVRGATYFEVDTTSRVAWALLHAGRVREARDRIESVLESHELVGPDEAFLAIHAAEVLHEAGNAESARSSVSFLRAHAATLGAPGFDAEVRTLELLTAPPDAEHDPLGALALAGTVGTVDPIADCTRALALTDLAIDRDDDALLQRVRERVGALDPASGELVDLTLRTVDAIVAAIAGAGELTIEQAGSEWEARGFRLLAVSCTVMAARIAERDSRSADACRLLAIAADRLLAMGAATRLRAVNAALERLATDAGGTSATGLAESDLFTGLGTEELEAVRARCTQRRIRSGEALVDPASAAGERAIWIVREGMVRVEVTEGERSLTVAEVGPGSIVGEHAIFGAGPSPVRIVAATPSVVEELPAEHVVELVGTIPALGASLLRILERRLRAAHVATERIALHPVEARLAAVLVERAERGDSTTSLDGSIRLDRTVNQRSLAAWVGARRETVNAIVGKWRRDGIIGSEGRTILVLDLDALRDASHPPQN
jgi:CRP/FNR family transcriptional regulator